MFYFLLIWMKKKWVVVLCVVIIVLLVCLLVIRKGSKLGVDKLWIFNVSYSVETSPRGSMVWDDIYVYDSNGNLVLSLDDKSQPQYLFTLYENYLVLDSGTSASQREMLVYDVKSGKKVFEIDYYPWENGLVLNDNEITFYKKIEDSLLSDYTLPRCENEYDNGYVENYGYTIWEDQANDLGNIQCAYFE